MTAEEIEAAPIGASIMDQGERSVRGLSCRVFKGRRSFYLFYRNKYGFQRRPKLGDYPTISIEDARVLARAMLLEVAWGRDPSRDRRGLRAAKTIAELYEATEQGHWSQPRYQNSGHAREVRGVWLRRIEPAFGHKMVSDLKAVQIREWHQKMVDMPVEANRALSALSAMFEYAIMQEWRPQNTNPCKLVKRHPERKRKRYATAHEINALGKLLDAKAASHPREVAFIYLLAFTGARPSTIERATRDQLRQREDGRWVLERQGKSGDETVLMPPFFDRIEKLLPREATTLTGIRFPRLFWNELKETAGCPDLWARDWRRTFATVGRAIGIPMDQISEILGHKSIETTKIYAKLIDGEWTAVADAAANKMAELMNPGMEARSE